MTEAQAADVRTKIVSHCQIMTEIALRSLTAPPSWMETVKPNKPELPRLTLSNPTNVLPDYTDYAALYYPWLSVSDPATNTMNP